MEGQLDPLRQLITMARETNQHLTITVYQGGQCECRLWRTPPIITRGTTPGEAARRLVARLP